MTIGVATASLLARDISGSESMAGLAQTFQVLGTAAAAFLLARLMRRRGRRVGLVTGYLLGAAGAVLAVVAGVVDSMLVLLLGAVLLGATTAANSGSRYAATDLAPAETRARALSVVVWATTIGAVAGPNLTGVGGSVRPLRRDPRADRRVRDRLGRAAWWRPAGSPYASGPIRSSSPRPPRPWRRADTPTRSWSRFTATCATCRPSARRSWAMACAHAAMVTVMIMTPLHMEHGGAHLEIIGFVISLHVLGMFAFSPLVGLAADRWGRPPVLVAGGVMLLVSLASVRLGAGGQLLADLRRAVPARPRLVLRDGGRLDDHRGPYAAGRAHGRPGHLRHGDVADRRRRRSARRVIVQAYGYPVLAAFAALLGAAVVVAGAATRRERRG